MRKKLCLTCKNMEDRGVIQLQHTTFPSSSLRNANVYLRQNLGPSAGDRQQRRTEVENFGPIFIHTSVIRSAQWLYRRRRLASEGIVTIAVTLSHGVCVRRISLGGEGNALCPLLSSLRLRTYFTLRMHSSIVISMTLIFLVINVTALECRRNK